MHYQRAVLALLGLSLTWAANGVTQTIYNDHGHIHPSKQAGWTRAGLLPDTPRIAPFFYNVASQPGTNWDERLQHALQQARLDGGMSLIYFPSGTYVLRSPIVLGPADGDLVFQGDSFGLATLVFLVGKDNNAFDVRGSQPAGAPITELMGNLPKRERTFSVLDTTGFQAGDWIHLHQEGFGSHDSWAEIGQIAQIESVTNGQMTLKDEASKQYVSPIVIPPPFAHTIVTKIKKIQPVRNLGIESLKILRADSGKACGNCTQGGSNVYFQRVVNGWVKGVESYYTNRHHVMVDKSSHIEVSGCYLHEARDHGGGGYGYGVLLQNSTTNTLVENNAFRRLRHSMLLQAGANSNVLILNYSREGHHSNLGSWHHDIALHGNYPFSNLIEQNFVGEIYADNSHGNNGPYNAYVRNVVYDDDGGFYSLLRLHGSPETALLGNILGSPSFCPLRKSGNTSISVDWFGKDATSPDYAGGYPVHHCYQWASFAYDELWLADVSYYYSARPPFVGASLSWPPAGPKVPFIDVFPSQSVPARERWHGPGRKTYNTRLTRPLPRIYDVSPSSGPEQGGTPVVISGYHFSHPPGTMTIPPEVTGVLFGQEPAASFSVTGPETIEAVSPAGVGTVDLRVTIEGGISPDLPWDDFHYLHQSSSPPGVSGLLPRSGPSVGNTPVSITGTHFNTPPVTSVTFGGVEALSFTVVGDTQILAQSPPGIGTRDVTVTNTEGSSLNTAADDFSYLVTRTAGNFAPRQVLIAGDGPTGIAAGDFDGDGRVDLVTSNFYGAGLSVLRNTSSGNLLSFAPRLDVALSNDAMPYAVATADFDGDGRMDLVVSNQGQNSVSFLRNESSGPSDVAFLPAGDSSAGPVPADLALGDFDADGGVDVAVIDWFQYQVSLLRNASSGPGQIAFENRVIFETDSIVLGITAGDFDGDGKTDFATADWGTGNVSVRRNVATSVGVIEFAPAASFSTGGYGLFAITKGDFDRDGRADLAAGNGSSNQLVVLQNLSTPGTVAFGALLTITGGDMPRGLTTADLDSDGKLDLAATDEVGASLALLRNRSNGSGLSFGPAVFQVTGENPITVTHGDFNGDGLMDLAVADSESDTISVFRNRPQKYQEEAQARTLKGTTIVPR